jgi:hypothetical protein
LLTKPDYLTSLRERLKSGTAGRIEELLYYYAWGKPKEELISTPDAEADADVITIDVSRNGH